METLLGIVHTIVFQNEDNNYSVVKIDTTPNQKVDIFKDMVTIVGFLFVQVGDNISCTGQWEDNKKYNTRQFKVETYSVSVPTTLDALEKYLGNGVLPGIGPALAKLIVNHFGDETIDIISNTPERLLEVKRIGKDRIPKIAEAWQLQTDVRNLAIFLQTYNISMTYAKKIYKKYGHESINVIKKNPYKLTEIHGIGFKKADTIGLAIGISPTDINRIEAAIIYTFDCLALEGNTCYPDDLFIAQVEVNTGISDTILVSQVLESMIDDISPRVKKKDDFLWGEKYFFAECNIASHLNALKRTTSTYITQRDYTAEIENACKKNNITLAKQQLQAVETALKEKAAVITGGPGTGKSTITKIILDVAKEIYKEIVLAAPTGRAAKRMREVTKMNASTIHRLIKFDPDKEKGENNLSGCQVLIVDESSMIDTMLMSALLRNLPSESKLILIGDIDQLPSVGPGKVLSDIIESGIVPVVRLTEIYRQAENSKIIVNAHSVNKGIMPSLANDKEGDFFFMPIESTSKIADTIGELITTRLVSYYGLDKLQDIQVLCPMNKGQIGTIEMNQLLQKLLNQNTNSGHIKFQIGDKVIQTKNNYSLDVYNGDIGYVKSYNAEDKELVVDMDGITVVYDKENAADLELAYAVTIHKYQGSECPCVIIPVHEANYIMLYRNLLYTGITRGKKLVILIGTSKAIHIAIKCEKSNERYTYLQNFLKEHNV